MKIISAILMALIVPAVCAATQEISRSDIAGIDLSMDLDTANRKLIEAFPKGKVTRLKTQVAIFNEKTGRLENHDLMTGLNFETEDATKSDTVTIRFSPENDFRVWQIVRSTMYAPLTGPTVDNFANGFLAKYPLPNTVGSGTDYGVTAQPTAYNTPDAMLKAIKTGSGKGYWIYNKSGQYHPNACRRVQFKVSQNWYPEFLDDDCSILGRMRVRQSNGFITEYQMDITDINSFNSLNEKIANRNKIAQVRFLKAKATTSPNAQF